MSATTENTDPLQVVKEMRAGCIRRTSAKRRGRWAISAESLAILAKSVADGNRVLHRRTQLHAGAMFQVDVHNFKSSTRMTRRPNVNTQENAGVSGISTKHRDTTNANRDRPGADRVRRAGDGSNFATLLVHDGGPWGQDRTKTSKSKSDCSADCADALLWQHTKRLWKMQTDYTSFQSG